MNITKELLTGSVLRDETNYEPGRCSNGGHYGVSYWLRDDPQHYVVLVSRSDYEDAIAEVVACGLPDILRAVRGMVIGRSIAGRIAAACRAKRAC